MDVQPLFNFRQIRRGLRPAGISIVALVLYATSFALPVLGDEGWNSSGAATFIGCFEKNEYPVFLVAMPNVALWFGFFFLRTQVWAAARFMTAISLLGGLSVMLLAWGGLEPGQPLGLKVGYYAWVSSMALASVAAWAKR